jgi:hypothetical protein
MYIGPRLPESGTALYRSESIFSRNFDILDKYKMIQITVRLWNEEFKRVILNAVPINTSFFGNITGKILHDTVPKCMIF